MREAVQLSQTNGKPIAHIARKLGTSDSRVHQWLNQLAGTVIAPSLKASNTAVQQPIQQRRRTSAKNNSTLCTRASASEQGVSSPPFGTLPKIPILTQQFDDL
jgi:transposase-like protein